MGTCLGKVRSKNIVNEENYNSFKGKGEYNMKSAKIQPSEMKVMNVLWEDSPIRASEIVERLSAQTSWSANTIYTLITRIIKKGFVQRTDPGFWCTPLVSKEEVQREENQSLLDLLYEGSAKKLFARMLGDCKLSQNDIEEIQELLNEARGEPK